MARTTPSVAVFFSTLLNCDLEIATPTCRPISACSRGKVQFGRSGTRGRPRRLYLPAGTGWADAAPWQAKGYAVVRAVMSAADTRTEAKRLGCTHALLDGEAVPL